MWLYFFLFYWKIAFIHSFIHSLPILTKFLIKEEKIFFVFIIGRLLVTFYNKVSFINIS